MSTNTLYIVAAIAIAVMFGIVFFYQPPKR